MTIWHAPIDAERWGAVLTTPWRQSLWASFQAELVYQSDVATREGPRSAIVDHDQRGTTGSGFTRASAMCRRLQFEQAATLQAA